MSDNDPQFHALEIDDALSRLDVDPSAGLTDSAVEQRRREHGHNRLREAKRRSVWRILLEQFRNIVVIILGAAAVLAAVFAKWPETIALIAVIGVNTAIGFFSEWKAIRSMEALQKMARARVRVRRDGSEREINADALVPGDVVLHDSGDVVPADLRLIEANNLRVNEAALTGESVAANKTTDPVDADAPLAERTDMLFKGTTIVEGSAEAVVAATGMNTQLGRIAELAESAESEQTPLERKLNQLGSRLAWITLAIAALVAVAGLIAGQPTMLMIETAIALGVAAIPEGLPIVATIALARGMYLMAKRQALINRLTAVETLGATRVIFTDKTGTLTRNRMTVRRVVTTRDEHDLQPDEAEHDDRTAEQRLREADPLLRRAIEIGVLCNNATLEDENDDGVPESEFGDPTEIALLNAGVAIGLDRARLLDDKPEAREVAFDPEVMMMATFHETGDGYDLAVKGAPRNVLDACDRIADEDDGDGRELSDDERNDWLERVDHLAGEGLRLLAVADRHADSTDDEPYEQLRFVALVGMYDPPAEGVEDSIASCQSAGVRVVMVTGDQPATAHAIGVQVGLAEEDDEAVHGSDLRDPDELSEDDRERLLRTSVFARVSPEQKLNLISIAQDAGQTVAMTGDGVNDAPALKKADIGVAMGRRGTDAAKQVADMVLRDDRLGTIVHAIREGRVIFGNIRKSAMFMLCTNVAEIIAVAGASLVNAPLPLLPLQILYLNVITDVFPALALGVGTGSDRVMQQPPRPASERVLTKRHWGAIGGWSLIIAACVIAGLTLAYQSLGLEGDAAVTVSFLTLGFAKLWFVFNLRDRRSTIIDNDIVRNPWVWAAIGICIALLFAAVYLPGLNTVLRTHALSTTGWLTVLGLSAIPFVIGQIEREIRRAMS